MKKILLPGIFLLTLLVTSCWYNRKWENLHPQGQTSSASASCDTSGVISYSAAVKPILQTNCVRSGCHDGTGSGAVNYNGSFNSVRNDGLSGIMMQRLDLPPSNGLHMPQGEGYLATCDTLKIAKWIKSGCPNN